MQAKLSKQENLPIKAKQNCNIWWFSITQA